MSKKADKSVTDRPKPFPTKREGTFNPKLDGSGRSFEGDFKKQTAVHKAAKKGDGE